MLNIWSQETIGNIRIVESDAIFVFAVTLNTVATLLLVR